MPVTTTITNESFDGNGSTSTPYPFTIPYNVDEDIKLSVGGVVSTDFTVSEDGIRTGTAVAPGTEVVVYRDTPLTQEQPFPPNTTPAAEDVRAGLDKLTLIAQEQLSTVGRALRFPVVSGAAPEIPRTASTTVVIDSDGNPTTKTASEMVTFLGVGTSVDAAAASAVESAASAVESAASAAESAASAAESATERAAVETYAGQVADSQNLLQLRIGGYLELRTT